MSEETIQTLIITIAIVVAIFLVLFFLRGKIRKGIFRVGEIGGEIETHDQTEESIQLKKVHQKSKNGKNSAKIHSSNISIDTLNQTSNNDNNIDISSR